MRQQDPNAVPIAYNVDGVWWYDAPVPHRWHRCKPQTLGVSIDRDLIQRCACGGIRFAGGSWMERNSRRRR